MIDYDVAVQLCAALKLPRDSCDDVLLRALDERVRRGGVSVRLMELVNAASGTDEMLRNAMHDADLRERARLPRRLDGLI